MSDHLHQPRDINALHRERMRVADRIALMIVALVGSMGCAAAFCVLALISLPAVIHSHDPLVIVAWVAQTFLQLVLLPIIIVGQNLQNRHAELRAEEDFLINKKAEAEIAFLNRKFDRVIAHLGLAEELIAEVLESSSE